jgi:hypothetical protein
MQPYNPINVQKNPKLEGMKRLLHSELLNQAKSITLFLVVLETALAQPCNSLWP